MSDRSMTVLSEKVPSADACDEEHPHRAVRMQACEKLSSNMRHRFFPIENIGGTRLVVNLAHPAGHNLNKSDCRYDAVTLTQSCGSLTFEREEPDCQRLLIFSNSN